MKITARVFNDILKFRKGDILFFFFSFPFLRKILLEKFWTAYFHILLFDFPYRYATQYILIVSLSSRRDLYREENNTEESPF